MRGLDAIDVERFWSKVEITPACWPWRGALTGSDYGNIKIHRVNYAAHRVAYELLVGPIAPGLHLDHLCRVTTCVNPAHLEAVPPRVNTLRGRAPAARRARQRSCHQGHPFDERNTRIRSNGTRQCRECDRLAAARKRAHA